MNGFVTLVRKECAETRHTWRLWVLPGFLLLQAVSGPVTALFTKQLLASMVSPEMAQAMPDLTFRDAWAQWAKNLTPMVLLVVMVTSAGLVAGEVQRQTAVLVLTKPVSRRQFVLAKFVAALGFVALSTTAATLVTDLLTTALFRGEPVDHASLWRATGIWLVLAAAMLAATLVASCLLDQPLGAAGVSLAVLLVVSAAGLWGPLARHSIAGLAGITSQLATGGSPAWAWPVATTTVLTVALVWLAAELFVRREV